MAPLDHCSLMPFFPPSAAPCPLLVVLTLCASPLPLVDFLRTPRVLATSTSEDASSFRRRRLAAASDPEEKALTRTSPESKVYVFKETALCPPTGAAPTTTSASPVTLKGDKLTRTTARTSPSFTPLLPGLIAGGIGITLVPQRPWIPLVPPLRDRQPITTTTTETYFEEEELRSNVTGRVGSIAYLECIVDEQQDSAVTWLHRKEDSIQLLTVGRQPYSRDSRFLLSREEPNNWRLQIFPVMKTDDGLYECQIATHPIKVKRVYFQVTAPELKIVDEDHNELLERYYKAGSEVKLTCLVTQLREEDVVDPSEGSGRAEREETLEVLEGVDDTRSSILDGAATRVLWRYGESTITSDSAQKTIRTTPSADRRNASVVLTIHDIKEEDAGHYTCSLGTVSSESVLIQVISGQSNGENESGQTRSNAVPLGIIDMCLVSYILLLSLNSLIIHVLNHLILKR